VSYIYLFSSRSILVAPVLHSSRWQQHQQQNQLPFFSSFHGGRSGKHWSRIIEVDRQCTVCIMHYNFKEPTNLYVCLCCDSGRPTDRSSLFTIAWLLLPFLPLLPRMQCSQHLLVCMKMSKNESSLTDVTTRTMRAKLHHHHLHILILIYIRSFTHSLTVRGNVKGATLIRRSF